MKTILAPIQVRVVTVADEFASYANDIVSRLQSEGFRAESDIRSEKIGYKIREAQMKKIPYTLVVGEKERSLQVISVRKYGQGEIGQMSLDSFIEKLGDEVDSKNLLMDAEG